MKKIYLDMNVFSELIHSDRPLNNFIFNLINKFKSNNYQFLYSPAHIEEVALILSSEKDIIKAKEYIDNILLNISKITDNYECLPTFEEIVIRQEDPKVCYKRVIDGYVLTSMAEINEKFGVSQKRQNVDNILVNYSLNRAQVGNVKPNELFNHNIISRIYQDFVKIHSLKIEKWSLIKDSHKEIEETVSNLFDFLEMIGYKSSGEKEYRSMMHDVTHSIYATKADIFITNDKKFKARVESIYSYLKIPTKLYLLRDLKENEELLEGLV